MWVAGSRVQPLRRSRYGTGLQASRVSLLTRRGSLSTGHLHQAPEVHGAAMSAYGTVSPRSVQSAGGRSHGSRASRSSRGSRRSRTSRLSRGSRMSRSTGRLRSRGARSDATGDTYDWSKVVGDNEAAVQEVVAAIQAGKSVSRNTWKKFDIIKRRARVPRKATPGPGAYLSNRHTSGFGKQVSAGTRTAGSVHMGTRNPVKDVFSLPLGDPDARRVKVIPKDVAYGRGRPSSRTLPWFRVSAA